jgi:hypothetical protein
MIEDKKERIKAFVNKFFVEELYRLQKENFHHFSFILIGEAIETLGGLLDNKPLKAKAQSMKRFTKSINVLMPRKYSVVNKDNYLYDKLRNQMVHSFIPSSSLILISNNNNPNNYTHLQEVEGKLVMISEDFYTDLVHACNRLFHLLDTEKIKAKMIAEFEYL